RQQARGHVAPGESPGHGDGWGIVHYDRDRPQYAGRSAGDAFVDPLYPAAVEELRKRAPAGVVLAHMRKASAGAASVDNAHPFILGRWSFCHNGTVWGFAPEGQNDSKALFASLHEDITKRQDVLGAIRRLVDEVSCLKHTSLTFLLTDGETLWGLRKVGNVDEECREDACAPDHYTLGIARIGEQTVVSQEHEFLGLGGTPWHVVPDGHVAIVGPDGHPRIASLPI
ncbi:MAG TPA: class II glutamine amidotransferase, partial [Candidatus Thermoplasmatota archaeon]|nr:class II glutamine amidotransferase [Candidatus Thermoplasmatota archaeon]